MVQKVLDSKRVVILGAILVAAICFFYYLLAINGIAYQKSIRATYSANITVIPGASIATADLNLLTSITPTATIDPNIKNVQGIQVNEYVQILGTEGSGLRIRTSAGIESDTMFVANESEVFQVVGGPVQMDDYVWWQLAAPIDKSRQGWAAADYLHLIEQ